MEATAAAPDNRHLIKTTASKRATMNSTGRRRPAVTPPARAVDSVPRYFETTEREGFKQYSVKQMRDCHP